MKQKRKKEKIELTFARHSKELSRWSLKISFLWNELKIYSHVRASWCIIYFCHSNILLESDPRKTKTQFSKINFLLINNSSIFLLLLMSFITSFICLAIENTSLVCLVWYERNFFITLYWDGKERHQGYNTIQLVSKVYGRNISIWFLK